MLKHVHLKQIKNNKIIKNINTNNINITSGINVNYVLFITIVIFPKHNCK